MLQFTPDGTDVHCSLRRLKDEPNSRPLRCLWLLMTMLWCKPVTAAKSRNSTKGARNRSAPSGIVQRGKSWTTAATKPDDVPLASMRARHLSRREQFHERARSFGDACAASVLFGLRPVVALYIVLLEREVRILDLVGLVASQKA